MSLKVGELSVELGIDDSKYKSGMRSLPSQAKSVGDDAGGGFASGMESGAEPTGGKLSGLISKMGPLLVTGVGAVGALAGVALMHGLTSSMEQEAVADKLGAQLGASEEMTAEYGRIAGKLYADGFGEGYGDITAAIKEVTQNGLLPEDATEAQVQNVTEQLLTVADVLDQDIGMTSQAVGNLLRNGLATDAAQAFDILTRGVQQGADKAGDLMETFQEYSTLFRDIGIDGATATGLLSQGLKAGARDADKVADALAEFAKVGQDGSEKSAEGYKMLGLSAEEMTRKVAAGGPEAAGALDQVLDRLRATEDPVKRNAAAVALFGTQAEDMGDALFALDPSTAVQGLGDVAGAAEDLASAYDNPAAKIESFKRKALQGLTDLVGSKVIPMVEKLAASKGFQEFVAGAQEAFKDAAAAISVFVKSPGFNEFITNVREGFKSVVDWITRNWPTISAVVGAVVQILVTYYKQLWFQLQLGIKWFTWLWQNVLSPMASWIMGTLVPTIVAVAQWLGGKLAPIVQMVAQFWTGKLWPALKFVAAFITGTVIPVVGRIISKFIEVARAVGNRVGEIVRFVNGIPGRISAVVSSMWNGIKSGIANARQAVSDRVGEIVSTITGIPGRIGNLSGRLVEAGKDLIRGLIRGITDMAGRAVQAIKDTVGDMVGAALRLLKIESPSKVFMNIGEQTVRGLAVGVLQTAPVARDSLSSVVSSLGATATSELSSVSSGSSMAAAVSGGFAGGRGDVHVHNHFNGPVAGRDGARWVRDQTRDGARRGVRSTRAA